MSDVFKALRGILDKHPAAPFLFIGSGFSRRYLGLEDWAGLLSRFCAPVGDFGYYKAKANGDLPTAASYIASDYHEWWWKDPATQDSRREFSGIASNRADALKIEISKYIRAFSLEDARKSQFGTEIGPLSEIAVDGIITTNWDSLLEELFPDYKIFVGQEELLFSNPQAIGEIYKIHGSASAPRSLILTAEDYESFSKKNPYLAAKLVTIFVEHPIIFIGYSITDPHIRAIITSIAECLTQDKINSFQENLIFIQRGDEGSAPSLEKTTLQSGEFSVTLTVARTADFSSIYSALGSAKRKVPARILRFFKEQLYELVRAPADNEQKIAVVDFEQIGATNDVEFVVGVGVARRQQEFGDKLAQQVESALARKGYAGVSADEVFNDCLLEKSKFDAKDLLDSAFPGYGRSNRRFIPVFCYLSAAGIRSREELAASNYEGAKKIVLKLDDANYTMPGYVDRYMREFNGLSTADIIAKATSGIEAILMLPFQSMKDVDAEVLVDFLRNNINSFNEEPYKTAYRKLVCFYDRLKYGF